MDNELIELQKEIEEKKKAETSTLPCNIAKNEIQEQYIENRKQLVDNKEFKEITQQIVERGAKAALAKDMLAILSDEQKNELAKYLLDCEKQKLDYRKKKEKKVVLEEVKAEVSERRIRALRRRYGYLYKQDENGEPIDFVANKFVNKYKEFVNWWDSTSDGFKKIVKGIVKVLFWGGIGCLVALLGYRVLVWIAENTQNLPKLQ